MHGGKQAQKEKNIEIVFRSLIIRVLRMTREINPMYQLFKGI